MFFLCKVVASLNVLFDGVQVGSNNALVMCMVTQLLGDWKWHADLFLQLVLIRVRPFCKHAYGYWLFLTFFLLGMDAAANLLQIESPLPCLLYTEDQLLASSKLPWTPAPARPAKFLEQAVKTNRSTGKSALLGGCFFSFSHEKIVTENREL